MYRISPDEPSYKLSLEEYSCLAITQSYELVTGLQKKLKKVQKLLELAKADRIKVIKNEVRYCMEEMYLIYVEEYFTEKYKNKNLSSTSKLYKNFIRARDYFRELLNNSNLEITGISSSGYEEYNKNLYFSIGNNNFELVIPILIKCNEQTFENMYDGKLTIFKQHQDYNSCWDYICSSYDESTLANLFNEALKKENLNEI